jgi:NHLM bacteriocin system ABC transporter ATP-binding protein
MATTLANLEQYGTPQFHPSNAPFPVQDQNSVWLVQSGKLDLFLMRSRDGELFGARHHVLRVEEGQAVFGVGEHFKDMKLVASPSPGATLLYFTLPEIQRLAGSEDGGQILGFLEHWITQLTIAISEELSMGAFLTVEPEQTVTVPPPTRAVLPKQGVMWVIHRKGNSWFLRHGELPFVNGHYFFPITKHGWLQAAPNSEIYTIASAALQNVDPEWQGVKKFHALAMACLAVKREKAVAKEEALSKTRAEADQALLGSALLRMAAPIQKTREFGGEAQSCQNPVFRACEAVGKRLGMKMKPHPDMLRGAKLRNPVASVAGASGVRARTVALKDKWWKEDHGPLLGFIQESKKPVALLPLSSRKYELYDPASGETEPVTSEVAATLNPFAHVFYRPLPVTKLKTWDLVKFALFSCRPDLLMIIAMGIAAGIMGVITPVATGIIFDRLIPGSEQTQLVQMSAFLLVIAICTAIFTFVRNFAVLRLEGKVDASVQAAIWDRLLNLPVSFFRDYSSGDLAQRSLGIAMIREALTGSTLTAILSGIFSIFSFFLLFYYSLTLAALASALVLLAFVVSLVCGILQVHRQRQISKLTGTLSSMLLQFISGIAKFRISGTEKRAFSIWAREFSRKKQIATSGRRIFNVLTVFNAVFPVLALGTIYFYYQTYMVQTAQITTGDFLAFISAFTQFLTAALLLSSAIIATASIIPLYERVKPIFEAIPEVTEAKTSPGRLTGAIELSHVTFRYKPDMPAVVRDVSLTIAPGEYVAFVGASGSGKSTLFRLLLGFETPESGAVYFDGQDLSGLDLQELRRQIGVVLQSSRPVSGSIYQNIVGSAPISADEAMQAAQLAGLDEDIKRMPMGLHTYLSDGGGGVSGGQRQRLMIARAIVGRPQILLFDEATSALDNNTQAIVSRSLESLQATRVVIAHRLSTIMQADRIYVLDKGSIVQSGTYHELIEQPGLFRELAKRQMI